MAKPLTIVEFMQMFPNDDACLEHLFQVRHGGSEADCKKCGEIGKFKKLTGQPAYTCQCGHHIHPMVGTPFHKSHTPLQKWFYAMYLFTTTRHGVPAKELQRQLAVNYKTAWRMGHQIRKYLGHVDGDPPLRGEIEVDEAFLGGKQRGVGRGRGKYAANKDIVLGIVQRGGDVITRVIDNTQGTSIIPTILEKVEKGSTISTDEAPVYRYLKELGYKHGSVKHRHDEYVRGTTHTQTIEAFWSILKRSIKGTHVHVSSEHLPKYLAEFEWRWNLRHDPAALFPLLLRRLGT